MTSDEPANRQVATDDSRGRGEGLPNPDSSGLGSPVTVLLESLKAGDRHAAADLLPLVYDELRQLAAVRLGKLPPGQTLQPTALVHEAYLRLVGEQDPGWEGRGHFFAAAARAMRDILVDAARRKGSRKHGARRAPVDPDILTSDGTLACDGDDLLAIDAVLSRLEREHPQKANVVMLRYFAGLTNAQAAEAIGVSTRTVERSWRFARAWLRDRISPPNS